jgi:transcriptional regulator with XRE-family HTH domain
MALFFDAEWFDAKAAARNLSRSDVAGALGITGEEIALVWKDQRELSGREVAALAALFDVTPAEIAQRAGVSTPIPKSSSGDVASALAEVTDRLTRLERAVADVKALLLDLRKQP